MSFLFGGGAKAQPAPPRPTPPAPRIGDGAHEAAVRAESSRQKRRRGTDESILTGLGSSSPEAATQRTTLLGGGARY